MYSIFRKEKKIKDIIWNIISLIDIHFLTQKQNKFIEYYENYKLGPDDSSYDVYIVGSDQVWNKSIEDFSAKYLLPEQTGKKISYAVSMGNNACVELFHLNSEEKKMIENIDFISVRERVALDKLNQIGIKNVQLVLDPTFLTSKKEWDELSGDEPLIEGEYLLFYSIEYYPDLIHTVDIIKKKYNLPVYIVYTCKKAYRAMLHGMKRTKPCSPVEFLNYIKNAKFVVSSSFHGCVFSVIFEKQFIALEHTEQCKVIHDDRIRTIMNLLDLGGRIYSYESCNEYQISEQINYRIVTNKLAQYIDFSKDYLNSSMDNSFAQF
jgi:hypothetical protein